MTEIFRHVPMLLWFALIWTLLAMWTQDIRGVYIATFCAVLGVVQMFRAQGALHR